MTTEPYLSNCARCGGDHFEPIEWQPLAQPHGEYTHWAPCPQNEQPILCRFVEETAPLTHLLLECREAIKWYIENWPDDSAKPRTMPGTFALGRIDAHLAKLTPSTVPEAG